MTVLPRKSAHDFTVRAPITSYGEVPTPMRTTRVGAPLSAARNESANPVVPKLSEPAASCCITAALD